MSLSLAWPWLLLLITSPQLSQLTSASTIECVSPGACQHSVIDCSPNEDCSVLCSADESCMNALINCPLSGACHIECRGDKACRDTIVNASASSGDFSLDCLDSTDHCKRMRVLGSTLSTNTGDFNVTCDGKLRSCANSHIECPLYGDCDITCAADTSCRWTEIMGPSRGALSVHCAGELSCFDSVINAANATALTVSGCTAYESCFDLTVYCSSSSSTNGSANCLLSGNDNLGQDNGGGTVLYAVNGWQDVELTYSGTFGSSHHGRMFCGAQYEASCELASDAWACVERAECNGRNHTQIIHVTEDITHSDIDVGDGTVYNVYEDHTDTDHTDDYHADDEHDDHDDAHDDHGDGHDDHASDMSSPASWPMTTRIAFAVGVVAMMLIVSTYCYCSRKLGHRFEQKGVETPKADKGHVVVYADGHYEYPHAEHSKSHHSRSRRQSRSHKSRHAHSHTHASATPQPREKSGHIAHVNQRDRQRVTDNSHNSPQTAQMAQMAQIYGHQSVVHHSARESSRRSRPTSAHTYSKHFGAAVFNEHAHKHQQQQSQQSLQQQKAHDHELNEHVLTKCDTLRSMDTLRSHTPLHCHMSTVTGTGSQRNTRSHHSSAIHTPEVHDHSAMDHSLTRSPSSTHNAGAYHDASGQSSTEPPQIQINVNEREQERHREKTDVSRVLSLTQHREAPEAKRSNGQSGSILSLTHNGPLSPDFEPALALHNEDSNMTSQTVVSEDVESVHGLLKMPKMVKGHRGHTPNVSMDSALSRITDVSTVSVFTPLGGSRKNVHGMSRVNTVLQSQKREKNQKRAYRAVGHREESESESVSSESEEEESDERRSGRRRGTSLARQRGVKLPVNAQ